MPSRNTNDATWYVLRYARDFVPPVPLPVPERWRFPELDPTLLFDGRRHVLELRPARAATEVEPLPGLAVDPTGEIYRVDRTTGVLLVRRCDGSEQPLVCRPGVLAAPAGLALDRRGYLYVADPLAHRVLVVLPDDGSLVAVIGDGLDEPVDVAVAPDGRVYVADRRAGRIVVFSARFGRCGEVVPQPDEYPGQAPRPIAVAIAADGAVLVADARYPRLLRFDRDGHRLADEEIRPAAAEALGGTDPGALVALYGPHRPRLVAGACPPCPPEHDGGEALAAVHRAVRVGRLRHAHGFPDCGRWVSAALDGGTPGTVWHKIEIDADLPPGTYLKVQTVTADAPGDLDVASTTADPAATAFSPDEDVVQCAVLPNAPSEAPDRLVMSPPGRWLRLRVVLGSDGTATPTVRAIRVYHPRVSYLDLLPRVFRRERESARFLERYLALFEHVLTGVEDRYELFSRQLNPDAAPAGVIDWLASLTDLAFDPSWSLARRRALVAAAMELYRLRGTKEGLERFVEIYTGTRPVIVEGFLERPARPPFLGRPGIVLGCTTRIESAHARHVAEDVLLARWAHRFVVYVPVDDECDEAVLLAVVERIVETNKPAHTVHRLVPVRAGTPVGFARVGLDLVLGGREAPFTHLVGCPEPGAPAGPPSVLGGNAILGERRPGYLRPLGLRL
jgi:phage tail-like protein